MAERIVISLRNRRLLILFPHMVTPGGALNYVLKLAEFLAQNGATIGIVTMRHDSDAVAMPEGVEVISLDGPVTSNMTFWCLFPFWQKKMEKLINQWNPDILIPQVFPSNWWGWLYRRNHHVPLLWVCHEPSAFIHSKTWIDALKPWWKSLLARVLQPILARVDRSLVRNSSAIVANSRFTEAQVEKVYGMHAAAVAYPPVDSLFFYPGSETREESILSVAALSRFKRVDFLLKVFAQLRQFHPRLVYHIVGKGDEEVRLRALANSLNLGESVVLHGPLGPEELRDLYRRSLIFLHGGVEEPFGMAPLEAIACGTPVVAHNSGGPAEYVSERCGRLVDGLNEDEWSQAVDSVIRLFHQNAGLLGKVAEEARPYSWPHTFEPLLHLCSSLLQSEGNLTRE